MNVVFTHRVVTVFANRSFTTKGDAAASIDPWIITSAQVRGQVVASVWGLGWW